MRFSPRQWVRSAGGETTLYAIDHRVQDTSVAPDDPTVPSLTDQASGQANARPSTSAIRPHSTGYCEKTMSTGKLSVRRYLPLGACLSVLCGLVLHFLV